jgi:surface polysaccharide O-acyltransferase-like enzyme
MKKVNSAVPVIGGGQSKKSYIETLRAIATLAVVFLHINMTLVANYSANEIGVLNYVIFNDCYILVKWAVPCFIMISGALLLNPERHVGYSKIAKYIKRMVGVLLTFGVAYAFMELVFSEKSISIGMVVRALFYTLQGKSWSHMWYIYMLIGLYLITVPLRYIVERVSNHELEMIVLTLSIGVFLIPSINTILGISLENYMLISEYIVWYLLGYYLSVSERRMLKYAVPGAIVSGVIMVVAESVTLFHTAKCFALNHQTKNIFTLVFGASIFVIIKECCKGDNNNKNHKIREIICLNSFAIYLIHPLFINIIYKVLGFTPLSMPIILGIAGLFLIVFALSLIAAILLKHIPILKRLL